MFNCTFVPFPLGSVGQVLYLIVFPDLCPRSYFDLTQLMTYCLTHVPYCICTANGFLAKTNKANSFSFRTKDTMDVPVRTVNVLTIEDGNSLSYYLKEITDNFKRITEKLYNSTIKSGDILVSTDMYSTASVKALERKRRGSSDKLIVKLLKTQKLQNWKKCLCFSEENKQQLVELMQTCWSEMMIEERTVFFLVK